VCSENKRGIICYRFLSRSSFFMVSFCFYSRGIVCFCSTPVWLRVCSVLSRFVSGFHACYANSLAPTAHILLPDFFPGVHARWLCHIFFPITKCLLLLDKSASRKGNLLCVARNSWSGRAISLRPAVLRQLLVSVPPPPP